MSVARSDCETGQGAMRIGEVARLCGVTTRTLRYWQEIGLITPSGGHEGGPGGGRVAGHEGGPGGGRVAGHEGGRGHARAERGERLYSGTNVERATRVKELQDLLGFSLTEIRVVLDTEDVLDRLRHAYKANAQPELQLELLADAMAANCELLKRLDRTLERITSFRDERARKAKRMRARTRELEAEIARLGGAPRGGVPRGSVPQRGASHKGARRKGVLR